MTPEERQLLAHLLTGQRVTALSVLVEEEPYVGLLPFAVTDARDALLVHASNLARHAKGLGDDLAYAALISLPDGEDQDPLRIPRLMISGRSDRLQRGTARYDATSATYLAKFPSSAMTFQLGDFHLYRLAITKVRFVVGFGRALNVKPESLRDL